jgi:hypothetical protein
MEDGCNAASVEIPVTTTDTVEEDLARKSSIRKTVEIIMKSEERVSVKRDTPATETLCLSLKP